MNYWYHSGLVVTVCCFVLVGGLKSSFKRPSYFPTCYRNDPQLSNCLLDATEQVRPYLAKGVPEINLPPFEPLGIPEIGLEQGTSALNFKATVKNILLHGLTSYKFSRFDFDVPKLEFFCDARIGRIVLNGDYTMSGKILVAPIEGKGKFVAEIDSAVVSVYQKYKEVTFDDGKSRLAAIITNSSIEVVKPKINLEGLFNGNQELGTATNKAINDNIDELFKDFKPVVEETITKIMEEMLFKSVVTKIPFDELYPVNPKFN